MSNPIVTIEMENGAQIKAELYPEIAPNTVNNFVSLVKKGFYDGVIFHRCIQDFMIQGGDPMGNGMGGPGYCIKGEFTNNGFKNDLKHTLGVLSMARRAMPLDSAGSQFFIMVADCPFLDNDYATFGKVTEGIDVVLNIVKQPTDFNDKPTVPQVMKKVTVETFGVEYPEPEKIAELKNDLLHQVLLRIVLKITKKNIYVLLESKVPKTRGFRFPRAPKRQGLCP
ncbi:MAG: peptidylprolyl isomerase [Clostridia bacterium]|nr:peptidylprolyl isomerase [Clostridia bacterium]